MLKKAGFVVAAAAATLLAVSPLAFAGDKGDGGHGDGHHDTASAVINDDDNVNSAKDESSRIGLINVTDNEVNVPVQVCKNNVLSDLNAILGVIDIATGKSISDGDNTDSGDCNQSNSSGGSLTQTIDD